MSIDGIPATAWKLETFQQVQPIKLPNVFSILADGTGDYPDIASGLAALPNTGGILNLGPGVFVINNQITNTSKNNIVIQGQGAGATILSSTITTDNPIFDFEGAATGNSLVLLGNTPKGVNTATISTTDAATLGAGDYVLIRSNKIWDPSINSRTGEILRVLSVSSGVVTLVDPANDSYNTVDSASMIKIAPISNIVFRDLTITSSVGTSSRTGGSLFFRFINGLLMDNVELDSVWWAGMQISSSWRGRLSKLYVHNIQDPSGILTHHGIVINSATRDMVIDNSVVVLTSNSILAYGLTGTNYEGVAREITCSNTTSRGGCTAHFSFGQATELIDLTSCIAIGVGPNVLTSGAPGFVIQGPQSSMNSCFCVRTPGRGIYIGGQASGVIISDCQVEGTTNVSGGPPGDGIYIDTNVTGVNIDNNRIQNCAGHAVTGSTGTNDLLICNNLMKNCAGDAAIKLNGIDVIVTENRIRDCTAPLIMTGSADNWTIDSNDFRNNTSTTPTLIGIGSFVMNNMGYNPVGTVTNPFPTSGSGNINNTSQTAALPASGTVMTNRFTPCTIYYTSGGTVTQTVVEGVIYSGVVSLPKLMPGSTYSITYTGTPILTVVKN